METAPPAGKLAVMTRILFGFMMLCATAGFSQDRPALDAAGVLAFARSRLPAEPVTLRGTLRDRAANGYVRRKLNVEMSLFRSEQPPRAEYRITGGSAEQMLRIQWGEQGPDYQYSENGRPVPAFDVNAEIAETGVTWADLSFSFLWSQNAVISGEARKLGRDAWVLDIPRGTDEILRLWIEQNAGLLLGAEEYDAAGTLRKAIKVVSVKEFDGLWMVKDLDIIRPAAGGRTSLRVDTVTAGAP